ncbi:MAG: hypothetical protein ABH878_00350, partial [bacterium]
SGAIFTVKYLEVLLHSSWALVLLTIPFILSYGVFFKVDLLLFLQLFGGLLIPLIVIAGSVGVVGAVLLRLLLARVSRRRLFVYGGLVLLGAIAVVSIHLSVRQSLGKQGIDRLIAFLESGRTGQASLLPHVIISRGFLSILEGNAELMRRTILTSLGLAALTVLLTLDLGKVLYYRSWTNGMNRSRVAARNSAFYQASFQSLRRFISPIYQALFRKDFLALRRHPLQWAPLFLIVAVWILYLVVMRNVGATFDLQSQFWKMLIYFGNFCFICLSIAAVAARFVFPLISLEGRTMWILKSAPLAMESFLWSKFWQVFLPIYFIAASTVILVNLTLVVDVGLFLVSLICLLVVVLVTTAMALGLGAIFADYRQTNPMKIANSLGGIFCIFICLACVVFFLAIFGWPVYLHYKSTCYTAVFPLSEWITATILFLASGIVLTFLPLKLSLLALNSDLRS